MEAILEVILQFVLELVVQFFGELFIELGIQRFSSGRKQTDNPFLAAGGYFLMGSFIGGLSLVFFRHAFIAGSTLRVLNLIATPIIAGVLMSCVGAIRRRKNQKIIRLDTFCYGFIFAFGMALVRFLFATK